VQAVKRHRGVLFSQTSKAIGAGLNDGINAASIRFLVNCEAVIASVDKSGEIRKEIWDARFRLLEGVYEEKLFYTQQGDALQILGTIIQGAMYMLEHSWQGRSVYLAIHANLIHILSLAEYGDAISLAVKCLFKIGQIDCDLLLPSLPRILSLVLPVSLLPYSPDTLMAFTIRYRPQTQQQHPSLTLFSIIIPRPVLSATTFIISLPPSYQPPSRLRILVTCMKYIFSVFQVML